MEDNEFASCSAVLQEPEQTVVVKIVSIVECADIFVLGDCFGETFAELVTERVGRTSVNRIYNRKTV